jgi:hypothetical protein
MLAGKGPAAPAGEGAGGDENAGGNAGKQQVCGGMAAFGRGRVRAMGTSLPLLRSACLCLPGKPAAMRLIMRPCTIIMTVAWRSNVQ